MHGCPRRDGCLRRSPTACFRAGLLSVQHHREQDRDLPPMSSVSQGVQFGAAELVVTHKVFVGWGRLKPFPWYHCGAGALLAPAGALGGGRQRSGQQKNTQKRGPCARARGTPGGFWGFPLGRRKNGGPEPQKAGAAGAQNLGLGIRLSVGGLWGGWRARAAAPPGGCAAAHSLFYINSGGAVGGAAPPRKTKCGNCAKRGAAVHSRQGG